MSLREIIGWDTGIEHRTIDEHLSALWDAVSCDDMLKRLGLYPWAKVLDHYVAYGRPLAKNGPIEKAFPK